jgi:hypothetical protein
VHRLFSEVMLSASIPVVRQPVGTLRYQMQSIWLDAIQLAAHASSIL